MHGNISYGNERELCLELEKKFFPIFFDGEWKAIENITWEVWLSPYDRIDYFGYKDNIPTYIEVKNWFVKIKEVKKIVRYGRLIEQKHKNLCKLYVICGGIHNDGREKKLISMNCFGGIILTKNIKEL